MSTLEKVVGGFLLALVIALCGETYWIHHQSDNLAKTKAQIVEMNEKLATTAKAIEVQTKATAITDQAVTKATQAIRENITKKNGLKDKVDNAARQVANGQITDTAGDAVYVDSMWNAYCSAVQNDSDCTARLAPH